MLGGGVMMGVMGGVAGKLVERIGIKGLGIVGRGMMRYGRWELGKVEMNRR